jgi:hypothetical protein
MGFGKEGKSGEQGQMTPTVGQTTPSASHPAFVTYSQFSTHSPSMMRRYYAGIDIWILFNLWQEFDSMSVVYFERKEAQILFSNLISVSYLKIWILFTGGIYISGSLKLPILIHIPQILFLHLKGKVFWFSLSEKAECGRGNACFGNVWTQCLHDLAHHFSANFL